MRRLGEAIVKGQHYRLRPGAYALLPLGAGFLVTCQMAPRPEIQLPGGGIDPGEQILPALHREVLEETGWSIAAPRHLASYRRFVFMPEYDLWAEKVCHIYLARPVLRLGPPREAGHIAVHLGGAELLDSLANPADRQVLAELLRG